MATYATYFSLFFVLYIFSVKSAEGLLVQEEECSSQEVKSCKSDENAGQYKDCFKTSCFMVCVYEPPTNPIIVQKPYGTTCYVFGLKGKCRRNKCYG